MRSAFEGLLSRYAAYTQSHPELEPEQVVLEVNMGLDRPFYTHIQPVEQPNDRLVLVNKYHSLSSGYVPPDLTQLRYGGAGVRLRAEAAEAFDRMAAAARQAGQTGASCGRNIEMICCLHCHAVAIIPSCPPAHNRAQAKNPGLWQGRGRGSP